MEAVGRLMDEVDAKAGRVLMREGAAGREFFIVVVGNVRVDCNLRKANYAACKRAGGESDPVRTQAHLMLANSRMRDARRSTSPSRWATP